MSPTGDEREARAEFDPLLSAAGWSLFDANPNGFGFEQLRIAVNCKHCSGSISAPDVRSFLGGRHKDDKGPYVSTGEFTEDARYEAERVSIFMMTLDLDDLVDSVIEHNEKLDYESRALQPLLQVYWPVQ